MERGGIRGGELREKKERRKRIMWKERKVIETKKFIHETKTSNRGKSTIDYSKCVKHSQMKLTTMPQLSENGHDMITLWN
jgi:hypothetical protein